LSIDTEQTVIALAITSAAITANTTLGSNYFFANWVAARCAETLLTGIALCIFIALYFYIIRSSIILLFKVNECEYQTCNNTSH